MRIVIIGSGNIAHFFAPRFQSKGHDIIQIYSREENNAALLAKACNVPSYTNQLSEIDKTADAYILAVKDGALEYLNQTLSLKGKLVIHCAGAVSLDTISNISENVGVIWTLYSINKKNLPTSNDIPLIVEANNSKGLEDTMSLAKAISENVLQANASQRQMLHLNAVIVNNFTNHLLTIAQKLSEENKFPFEILQPIIQQTFSQIQNILPSESQTGPAIRKDDETIKKHLSLLENHPVWHQIYKDISASIQETVEV
jgi:predicted short-subunit dehydrogenase-like oxidoreductase (DUF2520 family)